MITLEVDGITINILENTSQSTPERDFELLVEYANGLKEIHDTKLHEDVAS
ncbi:unknown [Clostridium sp. CAG:729]|nr:unknown [Clostridium sp. CAG:729]